MSWANAIAIGSAALGFIGGERRNRAQMQQALKQMAFQERMSGTAHQREVKDLRAAGLNPILSAKYGGASTPSGAQANIEDSTAKAISSGLNTRRLHEDITTMETQQGLNIANAKQASTNAALNEQKLITETHESDIRKIGITKAQWDREVRFSEMKMKWVDERIKYIEEATKKSKKTQAEWEAKTSQQKFQYISQLLNLNKLQIKTLQLTMPGKKAQEYLDDSAWGYYTRALKMIFKSPDIPSNYQPTFIGKGK